jgi:hypothetical protein
VAVSSDKRENASPHSRGHVQELETPLHRITAGGMSRCFLQTDMINDAIIAEADVKEGDSSNGAGSQVKGQV